MGPALTCGSTPKSHARRPSIPSMAPGSDVGRPPVGLAGDEPDGEERRGRKEEGFGSERILEKLNLHSINKID